MKAAILAGLFGFGAALAVALGQRVAGGDAATVTGVMVGMVAAVLVVAVLALLHRLNERQTARALSGLTRQNTPERATGHVGAFYAAGARVGPSVRHTDDSGGSWRRYGYEVPTRTRTYRRHPLGSASANAPIVETMTPARAPDVRSDFLTPMFQSLFSGFVAMLAGAVVAWRLGGDVLLWAIVGFVAGLAVCWLAALGLARSLVWRIERFIGDDIDGDGVEGEPDPAHAMLENPGKAREASAKIAGEHTGAIRTAELLGFLTRCSAVGTSEGKLGIGTSPQARAKYAALRDTLIQLGVGQWRDENRRAAGWLLTMTPAQAAPIIARHVRELRA